jgi:hypothetical protein
VLSSGFILVVMMLSVANDDEDGVAIAPSWSHDRKCSAQRKINRRFQIRALNNDSVNEKNPRPDRSLVD